MAPSKICATSPTISVSIGSNYLILGETSTNMAHIQTKGFESKASSAGSLCPGSQVNLIRC